MTDLFEHAVADELRANAPLADRMRPRAIEEVVGQDEALAPGGFLAEAIRNDRVGSLILWGPPGCGKTSVAHVISRATSAHFELFSAVLGGVKEVRQIVEDARRRRAMEGKRTTLFVDEIHRFNKSQQDAFLPHVESGAITLIGATTENPSFSINNALLSRCRVVVLKALEPEAVEALLRVALDDEDRGLGRLDLSADDDVLAGIARMADGDARRALTVLEQAAIWASEQELESIGDDQVRDALQAALTIRYDRAGDEHFNTVSAFIKSMRGSDPDAAIYYMCRMLDAGEDPLFILRRTLIFASEDVGNADPRALQVALAAHQAFRVLGLPEGAIPMAQAVTYCATAPKSNASYMALRQAQQTVKETGNLAMPKHILNAPTDLMKEEGYGEGYRYPHDDESGHAAGVTYLPDALEGRRFYDPAGHGYEQYIRERLERWRSGA